MLPNSSWTGPLWAALLLSLPASGQAGGVVLAPAPGTSASDLDALLESHGCSCTATLPSLGLHLVMPKDPGTDEAQLAADLAQDPLVAYAESDERADAPESCDADGTAQQCTIPFIDGGPGKATYTSQSFLSLIEAEEGQELLGSATSLVAVIDTGVDGTHPVLQANMLSSGWDFIADAPGAYDVGNGLDDDGDGWTDEAVGHGTHIAGTIVVVNPNALILPLRVMDGEGNGSAWDVAQAIVYAADAGARVINLSLGMNGVSSAVSDAIGYAEAAGATLVSSAGNSGGALLYPASDPRVVAIAGVEDDATKSPYSCYGPGVDFSAPGTAIYGPLPGGTYGWWTGTSMACAVASGSASLVDAVQGGAQELDKQLQGVCTKIDKLNPGYEKQLGKGLFDLAKLDQDDDQDDQD